MLGEGHKVHLYLTLPYLAYNHTNSNLTLCHCLRSYNMWHLCKNKAMYVSFYRLLNPKSFVIGSLLKLCIYASYNKHFPQDGTTPPLSQPTTHPRHNSQIYDYACFNTVSLNLLCSYYNREHKFNNNYINFNIKNNIYIYI